MLQMTLRMEEPGCCWNSVKPPPGACAPHHQKHRALLFGLLHFGQACMMTRSQMAGLQEDSWSWKEQEQPHQRQNSGTLMLTVAVTLIRLPSGRILGWAVVKRPGRPSECVTCPRVFRVKGSMRYCPVSDSVTANTSSPATSVQNWHAVKGYTGATLGKGVNIAYKGQQPGWRLSCFG